MIKINLVPPEYPARQRVKVQTARIAAGVGLAVLLLVGVSVLRVKSAYDAEKLLKEKQLLLQSYQDKVAKVKELEATKAAVEGHLNAIETLLNGRLYYTNFIRDLLKTLPHTLWFSSLNTVVKPASGVIDFSVNGNTRSAEDFAAWYARLETGGNFSAPKLNGGLNIESDKGAETYGFSLGCSYAQPAK